MRFPFREIHEFEDAQRNFERLEILWGTLQDFTGAASISVWGCVGVPNNALGANNDIAFRADGSAGATIYQKRSGSWVAVV